MLFMSSSQQVWNVLGDELETTTTLKTGNKLTTHVSCTEKLIASVGEEGFLQVKYVSLHTQILLNYILLQQYSPDTGDTKYSFRTLSQDFREAFSAVSGC